MNAHVRYTIFDLNGKLGEEILAISAQVSPSPTYCKLVPDCATRPVQCMCHKAPRGLGEGVLKVVSPPFPSQTMVRTVGDWDVIA